MGLETDQLKVYVRLPVKIKEELEIRNLHPDIAEVRLARQKSARFCFVIFKDQETLEKVVKHLKTVKINGKSIVVKTVKTNLQRNIKKIKKTKAGDKGSDIDSVKFLLN